MKNILIIDDDTYICNLLTKYLEQNRFKAEGTISGQTGLKKIATGKFDLVLCDFRLPEMDGEDILHYAKTNQPDLPVIIMTAYADVKVAVNMIKNGAFDYVTKPIHPDEILRLINRASQKNPYEQKDVSLDKDFLVGSSTEIQSVMEQVNVVAPTELNVLIEGETGSGKEYIARAIHDKSDRNKGVFIPVDCGAIPKELANSELFGHIKGAFTGAINNKKGVFEQAKGGTIFLDEVGNLPFENQMKLLRALQERVISKVGDDKEIKVDVRVIAATNDNLLKQQRDNHFREDLYYRLNGFKIQLPPLRHRGDDIMEFTQFFIEKANKEFNKNIEGVDETAKELIYKYPWEGNIRELQNVINRAVLLTHSSKISIDAFPEEIRFFVQTAANTNIPVAEQNITELKEATEVTEKNIISDALAKSNYNKSKAAKILNIDRKTLYNKIKEYNLETDMS